MLVPYLADMYFPDGNPAANYPIAVHPRASNQLALLFTDNTGATPAGNPITTDEFGVGSFCAAPGDYVSIISGNVFEFQVDASHTDPVWPGLWIHTQASPASVWTVEHHFGMRPSVDLVMSGEETNAAVAHPDDETTTITFGAPVAGVAYLRR